MDELKVTGLGHQGDGIAQIDGSGMCFIPFSLPGETVQVSGKGKFRKLEKVIKASPDRIDPVCEHFGKCGGCQLQQFSHEPYKKWKLQLLADALKREDIGFQPSEFVGFEIADRRRVVLSAVRTNSQLQLGFMSSGTHSLIDIDNCPVLVPELQQAISTCRDLASALPLGKKPVRLSVLTTENGLDIAIEGLSRSTDAQKKGWSRKAVELSLARLSIEDEALIEARKPILIMGKAKVTPPPGGFVQASRSAEHVLSTLVCEHLSGCKSVVDLYCGVGTFALRLAEVSTVWALEEHAAAVDALDRAWRETGGTLKQVSAEVRNLDRRPVSFKELKRYDGLVFDPPRAGAELQSRQIAKSKVGKIAAVSCNPKTLARDLKILIDGGYSLERLVAVDQFRFTPHLEVVALLGK